MKFIDVLNVFQSITIGGLGDAARKIDQWDDTVINALTVVFPKNLAVEALREVEPRIMASVIAAIESAENSGEKKEGKLDKALEVLSWKKTTPGINKVNSIVNLFNSVVKKEK